MDCKIVKNTDGKINDVLNQTGQSSSLFKQIFNTPTLSLDEVIELYKNIYSEKLQEKVIYQQLFDSLAQELQYIKQSAVANGTFMKAPNGQPTNLTEAQWLQTRTNNFKNWFGDWEKSPENASKVIDENGEPLVVFHGTEDSFTEFIANKTIERVFHFGSILSAKERVRYNRGKEAILMPTFLNIRNMARTGDFFEGKKLVKSRINHYVDKFDSGESLIEEGKMLKRFTNIKEGLAPKLYDFYSDLTGLKGADFEDYLDDTINKLSEKNKQEDYDKNKDIDGLVYKNTEEGVGTDSYIVLQPNQIKSATENIGTFSIETNDIRFQVIGEKGAQNLDQIEEATFRMDNLLVAREMETAGKTPKEIKLATSWEKGSDSKWRYEVGDLIFKNPNQEIEIGKEYNSKDILSGEAVDAYPSVKIKFNTNGANLYNPTENIIELDARGVTSSTSKRGLELMDKEGQDNGRMVYRLSTVDTRSLEHEYVHFIQWAESFSRGGSEFAIRTRAFKLSGIKDSDSGDVRIEKIKTALENTTSSSDKKILQAVIDEATGVDFNAVNKTYGNLAGEIEARSVEERIGMSDFFRKRSLVLNELNIAEEDKVFLMDNLGVSKQIIGGKGASRIAEYKQSLDQAKELESQGKSIEEIENQTGWFKNKQGQWKYFSNEYIQQFSFKEAYLDIKNKPQAVKDVIKDNIILQAYPELKDLKVLFYDKTFKNLPSQVGETNGFYNEGEETLYINVDNRDGKSLGSIFSHELAHHLQKLEGFSTGGGLNSILIYAMHFTDASKVKFNDLLNYWDTYDTSVLSADEKNILEQAKKAYVNYKKKDDVALMYQYDRIQGEIDARAVELALKLKNEFGDLTYKELVDKIKSAEGIDEAQIVDLFYKGFIYDNSTKKTDFKVSQEIAEKLSTFDDRKKSKGYPTALEVAEAVLPEDVLNKYKNLYEMSARNNIRVDVGGFIPYGAVASWGQGMINISKYSAESYEAFAETLNHEIIHGLLSKGVKDDYALSKGLKDVMQVVEDNFDKASEEVKSIIAYIQDTRKEFRALDIQNATEEELNNDRLRDTGNLEELITYAFTNKGFAEFLDSLPASKELDIEGSSIFSQLKEIIRNFFNKIYKGQTLLDEVNVVLEKYFDTTWNEQQISERNETYGWGMAFNAKPSEKANEYLSRLNKVKEEDPTNYWSVDVPSLEVVKDAVQNDRLAEVEGGMAIVTADGNLIGLFKDNLNAKNIAKDLQEIRVQKGGYKLDNFDGKLTKIYEKNGFRVVSRLAFNEDFASDLKGYDKKLHGTPDVVFMIYDPSSQLTIEEKSFSKDEYDEAKAYRDSFSAKTNLSIVAIEPNLSFETPNGEPFDNYSDALKNTDEGTIKLKINDVVIGEVSSSTDINTVVGSINDLVKQNILKGERLLNPNGTISLVTEGNSLAKKLINAYISEELFLGNQVKPSVDERGDISIAEKQSFYKENRDLDYKKIKSKYGADVANIVLAARIYEENTKAFGQKRLIEDVQEITPENELQERLLSLLNTLGVKTVSLNKYKENYKQRNGALPSSNALADIANRVIAFTDGEVTQDVLTEEVSHFILEAVNQEELAPLLENIHKTDEWAQYAEEYFNIYQDEAIVRKEILGKVLKNAIQRNFEKSQQTGTANTIIGRLAEIFNKFFTRISEFLTPQHRIDLDEYTKKIYDNLMLGELVNDLNQEQLEGNSLLLFQTSKTIQSEADLLLSKLNKALEQVEAQDRRLNSVSKEEILTLKEALTVVNIGSEEAEIARATLSISNIANRQINYLIKRDKRNLLSSEESAVFSLTVGYLSKVLTELESIIGKKTVFPNKKLITEELGRTLESIRKLQGDVAISQEQNVERIFDKVSEELDLDDVTKKQLLDNFNNITRDTNVFYAYVGGAINAHNPALNIASALISKAYADRDIAFNTKSKEFMNFAKSKGYTEEKLSGLMKKWKRGHHLFSRFDFQKAEKDMLDEKARLFKDVFGKEVTAEQLLKNEDTLLKAEVTDKKKIYYKKVNDFRQENQVYSPLTEEETKKANAIYAQVSLETQMKDKELSRQRSAITREAKRNNRFSEAQKFEMEELVRKREKLKNPFNNEGKLKEGLDLNEEDEVVIASGFTIDTLEADSKLTYELSLLDKLKAENFKNSLQETALPQKFINTLNAIKGDEEKLEFIKLNANISFSSEFWNTFDRSEGVVSKLREKGEDALADAIQQLTTRRKHLLKASRVFNNPSETNYEDLSGETALSLIEIESKLELNYNAANKILDKEDRVRNEMSESVVNQAYKNEIEDRDIKTTNEQIDFIKRHVTDANKNKIESARLAVEAYRSEVRRDLPKALQPFISSEEELDIDEVLIAYAETKLASYFKKLQPVGFSYDALLADIVSDPEAFFKNMPKDVSVVPNYILLGQEENKRINPKFAKNIEEGEPQLQLYTSTPEYKGTKRVDYKYGDKDFADYFGIDDLENPKATKNEKEYEVLTALYKFQDDTIDKADMKDKHSRYLLPQKRPETLARIANIKADSKGNLKEGFKELFAYREDDAIYGQTDGKMNLGITAVGEMTIPKHGFNRMETAEEVTDELLYSYMWMAQEAELRKSRVGILRDIESIRTILANKSYGDKHGESTETYKMFDDFVRFNMYGQSESFSFETNFGVLSKKVNLAPLVKKFQWWIRLVNLGFSVLTPLTSFLQGSVNFQIEKFVGERIDKDASRLARKQLVKLLPESMSDVMKLTSSSKLNIISEFMGQDSSLDRFKNSNYNRLTRGMASSAYMTHAAADVPLSAQVMLTVLHDFRIVNGRLMTFAKFAEENKSKTRKEARTAWTAYEDEALFNYIKIENGVASITDELRNKVPDIDKRMQNVRNSITVAKQEVDSQISSTDRTKMQRHALLSFLTLHKGWLITSMTRRFKSKHLNLYTGLEEEGSYSGTFGSDSFFSDLVQSWKKEGVSFKAVKENWKNSSVTRRRSMQRVASDLAVTNALVLVALLLKGAADGDDDKDYATQFAAYMSYRLANEVTSQSTAFSNQVYKFLQNPTVGMSQIDNVLSITDLASSDVIEGGTYKGLTKGESWMYKSLPALKEYWRLTNIEKTKTSYEYFNAPVIDYFTIAGALMKEDKEKEE